MISNRQLQLYRIIRNLREAEKRLFALTHFAVDCRREPAKDAEFQEMMRAAGEVEHYLTFAQTLIWDAIPRKERQ
jgi:hypothetical protein